MRSEKVKAIIIGVGSMGSAAIGYMLDNGVEIVAAIDIKDNIGKDVGTIIGREPIGVVLENDIDAALNKVKADIAFISTESGLDQIAPLAKKCIEKKINVVTIAEEAFYPWITSPKTSKELDELCKKNGVAMYASGMQDIFWSCIFTDMAAACSKIDRIEVKSVLPLEDMGPIVVDELYLGKTIKEYEKIIKDMPSEDNPLNLVITTAIYANCKLMGLHPCGTKVKVDTILAEKDWTLADWNMTINKGTILGLDIISEIETEENITWHSSLKFEVTEHAPHTIDWRIYGTPDLHVFIDGFKGEVTTTSSPVNRIPDVLNSEPGLKSVADFPKPSYRVKPLHEYVK